MKRVCSGLIVACGCGGGGSATPLALTVAVKTLARSAGTVTAASGQTSILQCAAATCSSAPAHGAVVVLAANPANGVSEFAGWSGDCAGNDSTCTLTMSKSMSVTAQFRPTANIAFVTSTQLAMPFGATADAAEQAADSSCQSRAAAAGLPGHYVAWLSTSRQNAIDKLGAANGWVRTDGRPFTNTRADLAAGVVFYPLVIDEDGNDTQENTFIVIGTGTDGKGTALAGGTCNDWTSVAGNTAVGFASGGTHAWTAAHEMPCSGPFALYCFETSRDTPVVPVATGRLAFVSKETLTPGPGRSRADADAICQQEARAAGLPGPFGDYLSLLATTSESAIARFPVAPGLPPWVRPDGVLVVEKASDLVGSAPIRAPINVTADTTYVAGAFPWTGAVGTDHPGDLASTCNDWGSTANSGNGGQTEYTIFWFDEFRNSIVCFAAEPVYCLQK